MVTRMATKPAKPKKEKKVVTEASHQKAVDDLATKCQEVSYRVSWLPTSRKASDATKNRMVETVGGTKDGFSISKRLFASKHPLVAELNTARRRIDEWRDSFTIVKSAEVHDETRGNDRRPTIEAGVRLIRDADIEEFDRGFRVRVEQLLAAADKAQQYMKRGYATEAKEYPSIMDMDRERLGRDFNEADYPENLTDCIKVTLPSYHEYKVSIRLPKEVYERETARLRETLSRDLEAAVAYACEMFQDSFLTLAQQLVNRTRINPAAKGPFGKYVGAEVVSLKSNKQDKTIPEGFVVPEIRYKEPDPERGEGKTKSVIVTLEQMTNSRYHEVLKPVTTEERKKITSSVIEHIQSQMADFVRLKDMMGDYGSNMDTMLDQVRELLATAGGKGTSEEIAAEIKNSNSFRTNLAATLEAVVSDLENTSVEIKKVRRSVSRKNVGIGNEDL